MFDIFLLLLPSLINFSLVCKLFTRRVSLVACPETTNKSKCSTRIAESSHNFAAPLRVLWWNINRFFSLLIHRSNSGNVDVSKNVLNTVPTLKNSRSWCPVRRRLRHALWTFCLKIYFWRHLRAVASQTLKSLIASKWIWVKCKLCGNYVNLQLVISLWHPSLWSLII